MKLRYFQTYDENGKNSPIELQYWDDDEKMWKPIPFVRVPQRNEISALYDESWLS